MLAVIADDFTGAAELAGISLSFGLTVDLDLNSVSNSTADVLVVCTDSRSLNKHEALLITKKVFEDVKLLKPSRIYKKIDSVLRGFVIGELKVQMQILDLKKAIIVPANPSLGRFVSDDKYLINGIEISKTAFANDPEFPAQSSFVNKILKDDTIEVLKAEESFPENGIVVAEVTRQNDLRNWANKIDETIAIVGAGDFYTALLEKSFTRAQQANPELSKPFLFVAGSAFGDAKQRVQSVKNNAKTIRDLSSYFELIEVAENVWLLSVKQQQINISALQLRTEMALVVEQLLQDLKIKELFIEGGSTAAAILAQLKINQLHPVNELDRGVVRMQCKNLFITVKPGSYPLSPLIDKIIRPSNN